MNAIEPHRRRRRRTRAYRRTCLGLLLAVLSTSLLSQQHIQIESLKGSAVTIRPGGLITLPIRITNTGDDRDHIALFLRLPAGWRQLTSIPISSIESGKSAIRLVTISPPKQVPAGTYEVMISALDSTHQWAERLIPITIDVERLVTYEVVSVQAPRFTIGGDEMVYAYEVLNTGNDLLSVTIDARSAQNFEVRIDPPLLQIPVGTGAQVAVIVNSPADLGRKEKHGLIITVTPTGGGQPQTLTTLSDILPRVGNTRPDMLEFPLFASVRMAGDNDQQGVQADVSGFGSLREDRSDRLEFLLRTPETQSLSVLGIRDEYRARYTRDDLRLYAGDWNYSLTTLTEVGRYAFGAGGETVTGDMTLGGFVNSTRLGTPARQQVAGYARYDLAQDLRAGLNVLHRKERSTATIISTNIQTELFPSSLLDVEAAMSSGAAQSSGAVAARLNGALPFGQYDVRLVNAGKDFASYYRDIQLASLSLTGYATRDIRIDLLARDERRNARLDTLAGFSPRSRFIQVGGGYSNLLSLYYRASMLADPLSPSRQDRREDVLQVRTSHRLSIVQAAFYADFGTLTDRALGTSGPSRRYAFNLALQPWSGQSYASNVEFSRRPDLSNGTTSERISATLSAQYRITNDTRAQISYFTSRAITPFEQRYTIIDASMDHVFASHHRVGGRVRSTSLTGISPEIAFSLEYGVPVAVPLGSIKASGVLTGRLLDQEGNGIAGVYITAGSKAAVTDETGLFAIRNLAPGTYALAVDRGTLGLGRILNVPLPFDVEVIGGEENSVVLRSVSPGILQGSTRLFNLEPTGVRDSVRIVEEPIDGQVGLVADLTNGEERHRRVTNARGVFVFTDLRPGTWKATFSAIRLPDDHIIERKQADVEIRPGESSRIEVRIVPRERRIRILQEGGVLKPQQ